MNNAQTVKVFIDSDPPKSIVMINNVYYGKTPTSASLRPTGSYDIKIDNQDYEYHYKLDSRVGPRLNFSDHSKCLADAAMSVFVVPAIYLYSPRCRDFEYHYFKFQLKKSDIRTDDPREKSAPKDLRRI